MNRDLDPDEMGGAFDQPSEDDRERMDAEWLLAREQGTPAPSPSPQIAKDYEELEHLMATLPEARTDQNWHDEVLKKAMAAPLAAIAPSSPAVEPPVSLEQHRRSRRSLLRWIGGGLTTVSAAAAVLFFTVFSRVGALPLVQMASLDEYGVRGDKNPNGYQISSGVGEIRVFLKSTPTGPARFFARYTAKSEECERKGKGLECKASIEEPGTYITVFVEKPFNASESLTLEEFTQAAEDQGVALRRAKDEVTRK